MIAETVKPSSPPPEEDGTAASKVLGDDDLLGEILHRVDSVTSLVRAALVAKRWLRVASDPVLLRRFRKRHPPRLLGIYVTDCCLPCSPEFIPMPPAPERPDTELTGAALRRAAVPLPPDFSWYSVWDNRNGRVLFQSSESMHHRRRLAVRNLGGAVADLPPPPRSTFLRHEFRHAFLLPYDDVDDATCYRVAVHHVDRTVSAEVTVLRSGAWTHLCFASAQLVVEPASIHKITVLAGGKVTGQ